MTEKKKREPIELSTGQKVTLKEELTWYDAEVIEAALSNRAVYRAGDDSIQFDGQATLNAKITLLMRTIEKVTNKEEKEVPLTEEWIKSLNVADGRKLYSETDKYASALKKEAGKE